MNHVHIWVMSNEYETSRIIGGLGIVATQLTNRFIERGITVTLLTNHSMPDIQTMNCGPLRIVHFPEDSPYYVKERNKNKYEPIVSWLHQHEYELPDVIHIHSVCFANLALFYKREYGIPVVYTCHSLVKQETQTAMRQVVSARQRRLLFMSDRVIVPSKWQKSALKKYYPDCTSKVEVIENGINRSARENNQLKARMLFVGRLTRQKGIEELLAAVAILARHTPYVSLDIVGRSSSETYQAFLHSLVKRWKIENQVKWLGFLSPQQVQRLYPHYGAVIVPSKQESFGLVALEALANGVPLVSTRSGGLSQFVTSEVAQVIPVVTGRVIAQSIASMWRNLSLTQKRAYRGFLLTEKYDWSKIAAHYAEIFMMLLNRSNPVTTVPAMVQWEDEDDD